jgi:hypothetical protein
MLVCRIVNPWFPGNDKGLSTCPEDGEPSVAGLRLRLSARYEPIGCYGELREDPRSRGFAKAPD